MTKEQELSKFYNTYKNKIEYAYNNRDKLYGINPNTNSKHNLKNFYSGIYNYFNISNNRTQKLLDDIYDIYTTNKRSINASISKMLEVTGSHEFKKDANTPKPEVKEIKQTPEIQLNAELRPQPSAYGVSFSSIQPHGTTTTIATYPPTNYFKKDRTIKQLFNVDMNQYVPSLAKNIYTYFNNKDIIYANNFKPSPPKYSFYNKNFAYKFVAIPNTYMFDILYFSDKDKRVTQQKYDNPSVKINFDHRVHKNNPLQSYLIGININTRYGYVISIKDKTASSIINGFEELFKQGLKMTNLIFDGERGISSNDFADYINSKNIKLFVTATKIHTSTAPIDRLCRTIRDLYVKYYILNDDEYKNIINSISFQNMKRKELLQYMSKIRKLFNEGDQKRITPVPTTEEVYKLMQYYNDSCHDSLVKIFRECG
ncbi:hypothetical protein EIN_259600 [Entamoeba invadens IP1]|uniref:Integrase catalytic domain-containing protein n=1 Tax=Entamoeba invadens IP1 TaxID=370355 RepID=A0A0A1UG29_ENTIV|nr:hypothetical protein EIN_259600 [Entamoeba invadens IP1]ELP94362.1 hypothetical protein EIN_259600 [Entamoeba invadens IP1]|eukprot:XP_004261133.1 hypothetical protein EIN_259600 [Entamoeba invadens IP1]